MIELFPHLVASASQNNLRVSSAIGLCCASRNTSAGRLATQTHHHPHSQATTSQPPLIDAHSTYNSTLHYYHYMAETDSIGSDGINGDRLCTAKVGMPLAPADRSLAIAAEPFDSSRRPGNLAVNPDDDDDYGWDESDISEPLGFHFGDEEPAERFWLVSCSEVALVEERFQTSEDEILRNHILPEHSSQKLPNPRDHQLIDILSTPMQEPPDVLTPPHIAVEMGRMLTQPDPAPRNRKEGAALTKYRQESKRIKTAPVITVITVPSIPLPVMSRSVVDGLTPSHYMKSCFRILDAIKLASVGRLGVSDTGLVELFGDWPR